MECASVTYGLAVRAVNDVAVGAGSGYAAAASDMAADVHLQGRASQLSGFQSRKRALWLSTFKSTAHLQLPRCKVPPRVGRQQGAGRLHLTQTGHAAGCAEEPLLDRERRFVASTTGSPSANVTLNVQHPAPNAAALQSAFKDAAARRESIRAQQQTARAQQATQSQAKLT